MGGAFSLGIGALLVAAELAVAVAPFDGLGLAADDVAELRRVVEDALDARRDLDRVSAAALERAAEELSLSPEEVSSCLRDEPCAARLARGAGADRLLLGSAAGLGRTYLLRLALLDAAGGVVEREVQRTVVGDLGALRTALSEQVERLLPLAARPWYRRAWVWGVVGVGLVAAATALTLGLLLAPRDDLDTYPLP